MAFTGSFAGDPFKNPFHVFLLFLVPFSLFLVPLSLFLVPLSLFLVSLSLFLVLSSLLLVSTMISARCVQEKIYEQPTAATPNRMLLSAARPFEFVLGCPSS